MEYLTRTTPTEKELDKFKETGVYPDRKPHVWVSDKNNTYCNQYRGMRRSQPDSAVFDKRWVVIDKPQANICRMCVKGQKKGIESVRDNSDLPKPRKVK